MKEDEEERKENADVSAIYFTMKRALKDSNKTWQGLKKITESCTVSFQDSRNRDGRKFS